MDDRRRLYLATFLRSSGVAIPSAVLAIYLDKRGVSHAAIGGIVTAGLAGGALSTRLVGFFAEHWGRRRTLITLATFGLAGGLGLAFFPPLGVLIVTVFLGGLLARERNAWRPGTLGGRHRHQARRFILAAASRRDRQKSQERQPRWSESASLRGIEARVPIIPSKEDHMKGKEFRRVAGCFAAAAAGLVFCVPSLRAGEASPERGVGTAVRAYVTNFGGDDVTVIDPEAGTVVARVRTGPKPHGVAVAPDGTVVYVSNEEDGTLSMIDPRTNKVTAAIPVGKRPNQLAVSADGRHVFVTLNGQDAVAVVDAAARKVVETLPLCRAPHIALRSRNGIRVFVTCEADMKVVVLDAGDWKQKGEVGLLAFPRVLAESADGSVLYQTIRWLNGVLVLDMESSKVVDRVALGESVFAPEGKDAHGLAVSPDGGQLWLTTQTTDDVTVIDTSDRKVIGRIFVGKDPNWIDFTPDGRLAVVSNTGSGDVSIIDARLRKVVATVKSGKAPKRLAVGRVVSGGKS